MELHRTGEFHGGLQQINWYVDHYRARTSAARPVERLGDNFRNFFYRTNQPAPFGQRERESENVGFLEGVGADQWCAHLASDADQGNGIHFRIRNAGNQVGRAGTTGGDRDSHFAG